MTLPADLIDSAAESIRQLNLNTFTYSYTCVQDVAETIAGLESLISRLPQAICQMDLWLDQQVAASTLRHDAHPGPAASTGQARWAVLEVDVLLCGVMRALRAAATDLRECGRELGHLADAPAQP